MLKFLLDEHAKGCSLGQLVSHLELVAHAGNTADYADAITYVP
jgi:hypothetical protein